MCSERVFVHLKLKLKVKINAHEEKKLGLNKNGAPDHFLSAKRLHTRPTFGSNDRFLLLKPSHHKKQKHGQTRSIQVVYLSKLESLSPNSRWILYKNTGSGEVERETRQPWARQRHLRCEAPPDTRIMMFSLGLRP